MKKLAFAALLFTGIAQLGTGCFFVTDDGVDPPPPPPPVQSTFQVNWTLLSGDDNETTACPDPDYTVEVVMIDSVNDPDGLDPWITLFDCVDDTQGLTQALPVGTYTVWVNLWDTQGDNDPTNDIQIAASDFIEVTVVDPLARTPLAFEMSIDRGTVVLPYTLVDSVADVGLDCAQAGTNTISVIETLGTNLLETYYTCDLTAEPPSSKIMTDVTYVYTLTPRYVDDELGIDVERGQSDSSNATLEFGNQVLTFDDPLTNPPFWLVVECELEGELVSCLE